MAKQISAGEVERFLRQFKLLVVGIVVLVLLPLAIYAFYLERRLDSFADSLRYKPPEELEEHQANAVADLAGSPELGHLVYVPAYSHIYHDDGAPYLLTITLSVRNTSLDHAIVVKSVRYFDTKGQEVKSYLAKPLRLPALATTEFLVARDDATGGSGANFLVEWVSKEKVTEPIIEAVMIDAKGQQGISFARTGRTIREAVVEDDAPQQSGATPAASAENE